MNEIKYNPVINDVRSFIYGLRYNLDVTGFFKKIQPNRETLGRDLSHMLYETNHPSHHRMKELNGSVTQLNDTDPMARKIKEVWAVFYEAAIFGQLLQLGRCYQELISIFSIDPGKTDFSATDLIVDNNYKGSALNYVTSEEYSEIESACAAFIGAIEFDYTVETIYDSEGNVQLDYPGLPRLLNAYDFKNQIYRDILMLMTRPLGKLIIDRILEKITPETEIVLRPLDAFGYNSESDLHTIKYSFVPEASYFLLPNGVQTLSEPPFMGLTHELLHLIHELEGIRFNHVHNPNIDRTRDGDEDEVRVLYNKSCCSKHPDPDPCNEELLRPQFNLPLRRFHVSLNSLTVPADKLLASAADLGADGDAREAFKKGVSSSSLKKVFPSLSDGLKNEFAREAAKNPKKRIGPLAGVRRAETPPPKNQPREALKLNRPLERNPAPSGAGQAELSIQAEAQPRLLTAGESPSLKKEFFKRVHGPKRRQLIANSAPTAEAMEEDSAVPTAE